MNILIYTAYYPAPQGVKLPRDTEVVWYFARECVKMGHDVRVVYMNFRFTSQLLNGLARVFPKEGDYVFDGLPVHYFDVQGYLPKRWYTSGAQAKWIDRRLRRHFAKDGWTPHRVFIQFPTRFTGIAHPFSFGVPTLGVFHSTDMFCLQKDGGPARRYVRKLKNYGYFSSIIRDYLEQEFGCQGVPSFTGIDSNLLPGEAFIEEKISRRPDTLRILYAGRFIARKKVDTLIRSVQSLPFPATLEIVGDGPENDSLRALAAGSGNIRFTGRLPREEVIRRMRLADVFVTVSHTETFGLVYLEAMAQGCLTVGSRGEGSDGIIVSGENGFLIPAGDQEELTKTLRYIHAMKEEERAAMIRRAYRLCQETTNEKMAEIQVQRNV